MIEFSEHAEDRVKRRKITKDKVIRALKNPDEVLLDTATGYFVAVSRKEDRYLVVVYTPTTVKRIVSVIVTSKFNIVENRIRRKRWVKL